MSKQRWGAAMDQYAPTAGTDQDPRPSRLKRPWIRFLLTSLPAIVLISLWLINRPVAMSDQRALAITLNERRSDGLTYRTFVEQRFRRQRCVGKDPGTIDFSVWRTEGTYEFIRIVALAPDSGKRCSDPSATIAGIPLARSWDDADYPDYRGRLGKVLPSSKGMDDDAEPAWLVDFRNGAQP
jgi:hypothetical protein